MLYLRDELEVWATQVVNDRPEDQIYTYIGFCQSQPPAVKFAQCCMLLILRNLEISFSL